MSEAAVCADAMDRRPATGDLDVLLSLVFDTRLPSSRRLLSVSFSPPCPHRSPVETTFGGRRLRRRNRSSSRERRSRRPASSRLRHACAVVSSPSFRLLVPSHCPLVAAAYADPQRTSVDHGHLYIALRSCRSPARSRTGLAQRRQNVVLPWRCGGRRRCPRKRRLLRRHDETSSRHRELGNSGIKLKRNERGEHIKYDSTYPHRRAHDAGTADVTPRRRIAVRRPRCVKEQYPAYNVI